MKNQNEKLFLSERNWSSRVDHKSKGNASDVSSCRYKIMFVGSVCLQSIEIPPAEEVCRGKSSKKFDQVTRVVVLMKLIHIMAG